MSPDAVRAIAGYYAVATVLTFAVYAWDKRAAREGSWRVSDRTLHLWTWAGGALGAIGGQLLLRHKSRHASFILSAWFALIAHAAAWWWFRRA